MKINSHSSNVWIVGFPKSGNTWLSYLCSYCFNLNFIDYDNPKQKPKKEWVRNLTSGQLEHKSLDEYSSVIKTHKLPDKISRKNGIIIYIQRDPRDVYVSYCYYMRQKSVGILGKIQFSVISLFGTKRRIKWFYNKWENHIIPWQNKSDVIVNYEKLLSEGATYLIDQIRKTGININDEIVKEAMKKFEFKKMSGGREAGQEDKKSFFRKGISGDWKNKLTASEIEIFNSLISKSRCDTNFLNCKS